MAQWDHRNSAIRAALAALYEEGAREHDQFAADYAEVAAVLARRGHRPEAARALEISRYHQVACLEQQSNAAAVRACATG
jgi:hypothetical protein